MVPKHVRHGRSRRCRHPPGVHRGRRAVCHHGIAPSVPRSRARLQSPRVRPDHRRVDPASGARGPRGPPAAAPAIAAGTTHPLSLRPNERALSLVHASTGLRGPDAGFGQRALSSQRGPRIAGSAGGHASNAMPKGNRDRQAAGRAEGASPRNPPLTFSAAGWHEAACTHRQSGAPEATEGMAHDSDPGPT